MNNKNSKHCCGNPHDKNCCAHKHACCGTTQVGERGQVVIPADARKSLNLKAGDKLITFVKHGKALVMVKSSEIEHMVSHMTERVEDLKKVLKK